MIPPPHTHQVISVHRVSDVGFTKVVSTVEGLDEFAGYSVTIHGKNENYIAQSIGTKGEEGEILACTPDLISVIDVETGTVDLHNRPSLIQPTLASYIYFIQ